MENNKKSQGWGLDFMIGLIIFSMAGLAFFLYSINYTNEVENNLQKMSREGNFMADNLLSSGYPTDWTKNNVLSIGISDGGRINETKLQEFYELSVEDYNKTKFLFNLNYDYFIFFSKNIILDGVTVEGIGKEGIDITNTESFSAKNLVKIIRYTIYGNEPINLYIYVWEEENT